MADKQTDLDFLQHFAALKDPRQAGKVLYPLDEMLLTALCGVIAGCESWVDVSDYGRAKVDFLRRFLEYKNGVPSHDAFSDLFCRLNPKIFKECFINWTSVAQDNIREIVAIDGKTLRRSFDRSRKRGAIHMVSAWACKQRMVLGQEKVTEKSNEITAIPALLELLSLKGAIVTIDAMGCQRDIAKKIVDSGADYCLALKENQPNLHTDVKEFFEEQAASGFADCNSDTHETVDNDHGRVESRKYYVTDSIGWLNEIHKWPGLAAIGMVASCREINGVVQHSVRFYLLSCILTAAQLGEAVRGHWGIENQLHWVLDVVFRDDECRVRKENGPENFHVVKQMALNMIRNAKDKKSLRRRRKQSAYDDHYLERILGGT